MTHEGFVLRSLRFRGSAVLLSSLAIALGVALVTAVDALRRESRAHFEGAALAADLVVGPKGDPLRIVLGAGVDDSQPLTADDVAIGGVERERPRVVGGRSKHAVGDLHRLAVRRLEAQGEFERHVGLQACGGRAGETSCRLARKPI